MAINKKQVYVDLRVKENPISYKILKIVLLYYCYLLLFHSIWKNVTCLCSPRITSFDQLLLSKLLANDLAFFFTGDPVCKLIMFIPLLTISSSISTMVAIAVDRFREIIRNRKLLPKQALYIITVLWIWSVTVSSPQLYEYSVYRKYEDKYNITSCGSHDIIEHFETVYAAIVIVLSYVVPLILVTISYVKIMIFVWKAGKTVAGKESQVLQKRMKIVRLLITITVVFALFWSPYFVLFGIEV